MCYLTLAEKAYPKKLAFQYLEELQSEFSRLYGGQTDSVTRPYAFIKFGGCRQRGVGGPGSKEHRRQHRRQAYSTGGDGSKRRRGQAAGVALATGGAGGRRAAAAPRLVLPPPINTVHLSPPPRLP